ncbi:MAG: hypothetical protein ACR2M9_04210 [Cyanophyceae cyanobacterium]
MSDWQDEPCEVCGRKVMDELACPERVSNGDIICVDCCGYDFPMGCGIGHDTFDILDDYLLEIYSAYTKWEVPSPKQLPDSTVVFSSISSEQRQSILDFLEVTTSDKRAPGRLLVEEVIPTYLRAKFPFWLDGDYTTDPYPMVINRRSV